MDSIDESVQDNPLAAGIFDRGYERGRQKGRAQGWQRAIDHVTKMLREKASHLVADAEQNRHCTVSHREFLRDQAATFGMAADMVEKWKHGPPKEVE